SSTPASIEPRSTRLSTSNPSSPRTSSRSTEPLPRHDAGAGALFALDHNYPAPIIEAARPYLAGIELVYLEKIDPRLPEFEDDWRGLLALHHNERPWDGVISNDASILNQDTELAVLAYTQLTLVAPVAVGHDPVRSTGLVLAHIAKISNRTTAARPQVWKLAGRTPQGQHPYAHLEMLASRAGIDPIELRRQAEPERGILETNPLN